MIRSGKERWLLCEVQMKDLVDDFPFALDFEQRKQVGEPKGCFGRIVDQSMKSARGLRSSQQPFDRRHG
jgi:hypothetical protein